jgi:hypothetical protein
MSLKYIRDTYGVPAKRGARIEFLANDQRREVRWRGTIRSARYGWLRVQFDATPSVRSLMHPTWNIRYLDASTETAAGGAK